MKKQNKAIFAIGLAALLCTNAQSAFAASISEREASNASGVNDTFQTADIADYGDVITGTIGTPSDVDVFSIGPDADERSYVDFTFQTTGDYVFEVWTQMGYRQSSTTGSGTVTVYNNIPADPLYVRVISKNGDSGDSYTITAN